jgi:stromal membrane-associated protein
VSISSAPAVSQVNAKNDIMSLFEKVSTNSPFKTLFLKNGFT